VIVFSVHNQSYKQCSDKPVGTYITPVANFMEGYLEYYTQIQQDKGYDDYVLPDASQYAYCTRKVVNGNEYWLQMGCSDSTSQGIAVNIYTDNTCTTRSTVDGYDDANVDLSEIQVSPHYHYSLIHPPFLCALELSSLFSVPDSYLTSPYFFR
jgi:hypothetical protein